MLKLEHLAWKLPTGEEIIKDIDLTIPDNKLVVLHIKFQEQKIIVCFQKMKINFQI